MKWLLCFIGISIILSCSQNRDTKKEEKEYVVKAIFFFDKELYDSSIFYSKKALELNDSSLYLSNIGVAYGMLNKPKESIIYLDSALKIDSNDAVTYNERAIIYDHLGNKEKAIKDFEKALKIDPNFFDAKARLANFYYEQEKYELAVKYFNELLLKEPENKFYKYFRGKSYTYTGKYEDASNDFTDILKSDSLNIDVILSRAVARTCLKQIDLAIADFKKTIIIDPKRLSTAYRNLAEIYLMRKKDKKKACEYIHLDAIAHNKKTSKEDLEKYCCKK